VLERRECVFSMRKFLFILLPPPPPPLDVRASVNTHGHNPKPRPREVCIYKHSCRPAPLVLFSVTLPLPLLLLPSAQTKNNTKRMGVCPRCYVKICRTLLIPRFRNEREKNPCVLQGRRNRPTERTVKRPPDRPTDVTSKSRQILVRSQGTFVAFPAGEDYFSLPFFSFLIEKNR